MNLTPTLAEVGERAVIDAIRAAAPSGVNGDDAAVIPATAPNSRTVAATDMLVEGRHFRLDWSSAQQVGFKAITQNFADIEAMGARPSSALLALAAPGDTPLHVIEGIAQGIAKRCKDYQAELVGGDVTRADQIILSVTAIGQLGGSRSPLSLDAARVGQKVVAHGHIGYSAAGLALLQRFGNYLPPGAEGLARLKQAHCAPSITAGRGLVARATGVTAMTDNSDGLIKDLSLIAERSSVAVDLDARALGPDALLKEAGELLGIDPWEWILTGGEDHTLLGTTHKDCPSGFRVIGEVTKKNGAGLVTVDGAAPAHHRGWESFA
ncbi:thiamine-phosphate kinase [Corynebacterium endometrii]|uniref:Thiamine-monophosphate kinase n=1 Tax=Corynebacterium endometrii TaxID=2488819 RepID=A0A4V1CEJ5_9CORY|nr:thiamine-phosphate kinase [Corynebacterium endometrii]QCB28328.1 Thiamine-monophosphate kinase [Corynebacterium endometrii]